MPAAPPWRIPEGYDGETHYGYMPRAMTPAIGILAIAAALLFAML